MNTIRLVDTKEIIGTVSDEELDEIIDALEEETEDDQDYYVDANTLDYMEGLNVSANVLAMLKTALAAKESIDIEWDKA